MGGKKSLWAHKICNWCLEMIGIHLPGPQIFLFVPVISVRSKIELAISKKVLHRKLRRNYDKKIYKSLFRVLIQE